MFSLSFPFAIENTPAPPPKTSHSPCFYSYSCSRFQTLRFPSPTILPLTIIKLRTTRPPNAALRDEANDGTSLAGYLPGSEPLPPELQPELMPKHVAVIMDGHGRWAKQRGLTPSAGHQAGRQQFRRLVRLSCSWGIKVLTVFLFATNNWFRSKLEVNFIMGLFERTLDSDLDGFKRDGIRISVIGDLSRLRESCQRLVRNAEESTKDNSRLHLIFAVSYGGKYDVIQACKRLAKKVKDGLVHLDDINENVIEQELETNCTEFPHPDLLIRTGGELRVSDFMLWQLAYTEFFFHPEPWPDFGKDDFVEALISFQQRQRRFGGRPS